MADNRIVNPDGTVEKRRPSPASQRRSKGIPQRVSPNYVPPAARGAQNAQSRRKTAPPTYGEWQKRRNDPYAQSYPPPNTRVQRKSPERPVPPSLRQNEIRQMHIPIPPSPRGTYNQTSNPYYDRTGAGKATGETAREIQKKLKKSSGQPSQNSKKSSRPAPDYIRSSVWAMPESSPIYSAPPHAGQKAPPQETPRKKGVSKEEKKAKKAEKRAKRRFMIKSFFIRLGIMFLATLTVFGLLYYFTFSSGAENSEKIEYYVRIGERYSFTAGKNMAFCSGVMYTNFSELARIFSITSVGSVDSVRFIITNEDSEDSAGCGKEEYVIFTDGVRSATVNGTVITMDGKCVTSGTDIWVPFSFVEQYIRGIVSEKDGDTVIISAEKEEEDENGQIMFPELSFAICNNSPAEHIEYPSDTKSDTK